MGSSKQISSREVISMVLLLQQGGLFWMLPMLLLGNNGTAGLITLLPGVLFGMTILAVCVFWGNRFQEQEILQWLMQRLGKPAGMGIGLLFVLLYLAFAVICLDSLVEVISSQLLRNTPRLLILIPVFLLSGWLAWNGLEDIARLMVLCIAPAVILFLVALAGNVRDFSLEHLLPLQLQAPEQLLQSSMHSIFSFSSFLVLFLIYPALHSKKNVGWKLSSAIIWSALMLLVWTGLALGVFGQSSVGPFTWLPLELARMIRLGSFLERTEALFTAVWMVIVLVDGGLLLWSVSESAHQLLKKQKSRWLHWSLILAAFLLCAGVGNRLELFRMEQIFATVTAVILPILLLVVWMATVLQNRKKEGQQP